VCERLFGTTNTRFVHTLAGVGGHGILNAGGQKPECWRPRKLNGCGQETCSTG
jgi:hypothetical protein